MVFKFPWRQPQSFTFLSHKNQKLFSDSYYLLRSRPPRWMLASAVVLSAGGVTFYNVNEPFRYSYLAVERISRIAKAVVLGAIDYKMTFAKEFANESDRVMAYSECHSRSAKRVLRALLDNGGIFIKLGQHISSLVVLPLEWTETMRPLQDRCDPTPFKDIQDMVLLDTGQPIEELFEEFDPNPIGVASLAQVHAARLKGTGQRVAVKLQHPRLQEFVTIDMDTVSASLSWIKSLFPEFEFTWLGEEMRENLPREMDFVHEAQNAARAVDDFRDIRTTLYIPKVINVSKRILIMEFIEGGRPDDLEYLARHKIDRNRVAQELQRIFCQMVHINGWFHADPHPGNLFIRPSPPNSKSPFNFEIVLLDHGLYFDLEDELRINYSKLWLTLIKPGTAHTVAERKKYAQLVGNIGPDLYPIFESAITGRAGLEGTWGDGAEGVDSQGRKFKRANSMMDISTQTEEELDAMRTAVIRREGLLRGLFDLLRRLPRRVLMVLKLNDLTRNLDHALQTTHSKARIFVITARFCAYAVWLDDWEKMKRSFRQAGLTFSLVRTFVSRWWEFHSFYHGLRLLEVFMDAKAAAVKQRLWLRGLFAAGLRGARLEAAGLAI